MKVDTVIVGVGDIGASEFAQLGHVENDLKVKEEKTYFDSGLNLKISDYGYPFTWIPPRRKYKPAPVFGLTKAQTKRRKANKAAKIARRKNRK